MTRTHTRVRAALLACAAGLVVTLPACNQGPPPCGELKPPTSEMVASTNQGAEVEKEPPGTTAECVVVVTDEGRGVWEDQSDDE